MTSKRLFLSPPHMCGEELDFIKKAFAENYIAPVGPQVDAFEREFCEKVGIAYAVAVSSGTAAMHLALRILGIGPGDEVLASTLTFIGSVTPVVFQGATPVFIDSDRTSWNMDPDLLMEELERCEKKGQLPKALIPTDLYGQCADLDRILAICNRFDIPVVVDSAEAVGSRRRGSESRAEGLESKNKGLGAGVEGGGVCEAEDKKTEHVMQQWVHAGVGAKAAVFSFNGNKIITTSGGGMLASDDQSFVEQARFLSRQARDPFPYYEHSQIGYNYRMSNIIAAIGRGQLRVLDERVEARRTAFDYYRKALSHVPGIEFMPEADYSRSNRWLTVILITPEVFGCDGETVRLVLEAENIESRPVWKPMHMQPIFSCSGLTCNNQYKARAVGGAVAEDLFKRGLCLPSGSAMNSDDLDRVIDAILKMQGDNAG